MKMTLLKKGSMKKLSKRKTRYCGLHSCLRHILIMCHWSGHFPVDALRNPKNMRFNFKSFYYIGSCMALIINMVACTHTNFFNQNNRTDYTSFMVVVTAVVVTALMYRLAKHWPELVQDATNIEQGIAEMVHLPNSTHVKCAVLSYAVVAIGFVEHIFYFNLDLQAAIFCSQHNQWDSEALDIFLRKRYATTFDYLPFYRWLAVFAEFVRVQNSFMWNLIDIIVMCFSIYLTTYFQELGKVIWSNEPKNWSTIRACYSRLAILLNLSNKQLAPVIFATSFFNLFFICKQLYNILHKEVSFISISDCGESSHSSDLDTAYQLYYNVSFFFLLTRSMTFMYMATNVHSSARKAVLPLYAIPSSEYDEEVECFQMQLRYNNFALSGGFFYITRQTILRVVAAIVTYELVLLEFSFPQKFSVKHVLF